MSEIEVQILMVREWDARERGVSSKVFPEGTVFGLALGFVENMFFWEEQFPLVARRA